MTAVLERPGDDSEDWEQLDQSEAAGVALTGENVGTCAPGLGIDEVDIATDGEAGLATAEYAIATIAAVGFGALLMVVLSSSAVQKLLENVFKAALTRGLG